MGESFNRNADRGVYVRRRLVVAAGAVAVVGGGVALAQRIITSRWNADTGVAAPAPADDQGCRTPGPLDRFATVGGAALGYESEGVLVSMQAEPRFVEWLDAWAEGWAEASGFGGVREVWSYGAFTDKCRSYHQLGRAFDIGRIIHDNGEVSCRHDVWSPGSADQLRNYWRLAASLHARFAHTLTYLYDGAHDNHIHVDNSVNGYEPTVFTSDSRVQVQLVQASLQHVHGAQVEITGQWDDQTRTALRAVQKSLGITRPLADREGWQEFLRATVAG